MARENDCQSVGVTLVNVGVGGSLFTFISPVPNQVGLIMTMKGAGGTLEISGGGFSQAPSGTILGNQPALVANGSGYPMAPTAVMSFNGAPSIWLSSGGITTTVSVMYLKNSQSGGQGL